MFNSRRILLTLAARKRLRKKQDFERVSDPFTGSDGDPQNDYYSVVAHFVVSARALK
jgi:hypothetical protein